MRRVPASHSPASCSWSARCCWPTRSSRSCGRSRCRRCTRSSSRAGSTTTSPSSRAPSRPRPTARCSRASARSTASSPTRRARSTAAPTTASRWGASACARSASTRWSWRAPTPSSLRRGPGHYPGTPLPGARGTVAIAGHRTTYGAPFRRLDKLDARRPHRGRDAVRALRLRGRAAADRAADARRGSPSGCATTGSCCRACHPLYSAAKRIVVFARLVDTKPRSDRLA